MSTTTTTYNWLRQKIKTLPSIRNVHRSLDTPADLIVRTWVGMSVNIYFLDGVPNLRAIKRLLHDNTRVYQASLFVLHHQLLPPDRKRLVQGIHPVIRHETFSIRRQQLMVQHEQRRLVNTGVVMQQSFDGTQ
ncbi:MAG: hypothetical protein AAF653_09960, partial [Chloroflexota bacterium]